MTTRGSIILFFVLVAWCALAAWATNAAEERCTIDEVASFEKMYARGSVHCDPRTAKCIHYLGTIIKNGTCYIAVRPVR